VFSGPDIKSPVLETLPLGASVAVSGEASDHNARYGMIEPAGAIVMQHLMPLGAEAGDYVAVAETLLGTPYLWAGCSAFGIDCSGLVQLAMRMTGRHAPRDSDMQEAALGTALDIASGLPPLQRGDLVFWKGHLGIMQDGERLLHANAHHMAVASEPLSDAIARLEAAGCPVTSIRRL
jgi:cell wall-associated NlpC family hydrolase